MLACFLLADGIFLLVHASSRRVTSSNLVLPHLLTHSTVWSCKDKIQLGEARVYSQLSGVSPSTATCCLPGHRSEGGTVRAVRRRRHGLCSRRNTHSNVLWSLSGVTNGAGDPDWTDDLRFTKTRPRRLLHYRIPSPIQRTDWKTKGIGLTGDCILLRYVW